MANVQTATSSWHLNHRGVPQKILNNDRGRGLRCLLNRNPPAPILGGFLEGKARMRFDEKDQEVRPGMLLYVGASMEHSFFEIEEEMLLLVFFSA